LKEFIGSEDFPIWLLGDSNPKRWELRLDTPLDPRHPARHSIWTPILEQIQETVFKECRSRVDTSRLYIRNAIESSDIKPRTTDTKWPHLQEELDEFGKKLSKKQPQILLTFGSFAFEFARRARREEPLYPYGYWNTLRLGSQFAERLGAFDPADINLIPLLHASIARGRFLESHRDFCIGFSKSENEATNYFNAVGQLIGHKLYTYRSHLPIWIE
jgi:hypothetical protein